MAPKKPSVVSEPVKAKKDSNTTFKKDSNTTFESKSVFDIKELREGLAKRWANERFRTVATQRLRRLDIQWDEEVRDANMDSSDPLPSRVQRDDVVSGTDGEKWNQKKRRLGSSAARSDGTTALHQEIAAAVIELKDALPPKPWHDTMRFVSFDIPKNGKEFERWIEMLVKGKEADDKCVEGIFSVVPSMRNHPETEMYLREMILPFRSFYVAHIIAHVLQLRHRKTSAHHEDEDDASHIERLENLLEAKGVEKTVYKSQKHAALHSSNLEDVFAIEAFLPDDSSGLRRHWEAMRKKNTVARYAEYHLLYLNSMEEDSDELWVARMRPLAEAGLAHSQFDLGLCLLAQKKHEEGCTWLERAANLGHTKAMSELGRFYFGEAMGWNPTAVDSIKLKKQGTSSQDKASKIRQDVKNAMKWLETLIDADLWDGETNRDKKDAERMLKTIEADAKKLIEYERAKEIVLAKEKKQRFGWILFYCVFGILIAWSLYEYSRPVSPTSATRLPVEPSLEDATHVSQHRAFLV